MSSSDQNSWETEKYCFDDINYLKLLLKAHLDWFLDELLFLLETN